MNRHGWSIRPWVCGERGGRGTGEDDLQLLEPADWMRAEYLAYIAEFRAMGAANHQHRREQAICDFPGMLQAMQDHAGGRNLAGDHVPQTDYWLFCGERLVATCRLRHRLNEHLAQHGGHIGYDVRPSEWRKGYATRMLALVVEKAREMGLERVMLTCDKENVASARTIQKNGGKLDREYWWEEKGEKVLIQNYWIELQ